MVNLNRLEQAIKHSWDGKTSTNPNWSASNPSLGQCAVTACVVQDYIGGKIVWAGATFTNGDKESHYFNKLGNTEYDFTRLQFPVGTDIPPGIEKKKRFNSTREYVLSFDVTRVRYELLKDRVTKLLDD